MNESGNLKTSYEEFINFIRFEKRLSKNTVSSYTEDLLKYFEFLNSKKIYDIKNIETSTIENYLIYLKNNE